MKSVLAFIDGLLERIPHGAVRLIRLGALLFWLILATVVVFYSWSFGSQATPTSGQDLSLTTIREKIEREKNLKNPPDLDISDRRNITIPDIGELEREASPVIPYLPTPRRGNELEEKQPSPSGSQSQSQLPFLGSRVNREGELYPPKYYIPEKDSGVGGARESALTGPGQREQGNRFRSTHPVGSPEISRSEDESEKSSTETRGTPTGSVARSPEKDEKKSIYPRSRKGSFGFLPP